MERVHPKQSPVGATNPEEARLLAQAASLTIIGIDALAGGLNAMTKLIAATPIDSAFASVFVQHLDPTHPGLLVELLGEHTAMPVVEAADEVPLIADHVYVIPRGTYLLVEGLTLHIGPPTAKHGARVPMPKRSGRLATGAVQTQLRHR